MNRTIRVDDVFTAAYMLAMGARLARIVPGPFVRWEFHDGDGTASRLRAAFTSGEPVPCDAHTLFDCQQRCRRDVVTFKRAA